MDTTDLSIHRFGTQGAPIAVLLHGLTEAGTAWPDLVAHWGDAWDIVAVDLRGHGLSPRFTEAELLEAPEVMLADIVAVLDSLGSPAVVVGHSLGGYFALRAALARPDAVRALVVEDPAQPAPGRTPIPEFAGGTDDFLEVMADPTTRAAKIDEMLTESSWSEAEIDEWARCKPLVDREYVRRGSYLDDGEWESHFAALTVPTLLVSPPDTPMAPDMTLVDNPLVARVVIPDSGHCVRRDQPAAYHLAVDGFLARVPLR